MSNGLRQGRRLLAVAMLLLAAATAGATEYHGTVTFNGLPLPGATVTATQGEKKFSATSGSGGEYSFADLPDGAWTIEIEMLGFEPVKQQVTVATGVAVGTAAMKLQSIDQIRSQSKPILLAVNPATMASGTNVPTASASVAAAKTSSTVKKPAASAQPNAPAPAPAPADDAQQARASDGLLINGSVTNAATSQFSQNQRFGNAVNNGRHLYSGMIGLVFDNSVLNASPYSVAGLVVPKPNTNVFNGSFLLGGPIRIPHVMRNGPNFTVVYEWDRSSTVSNDPQNVPDPTAHTPNGQLPGCGAPSTTWDFSKGPNAVKVYDPITHTEYPGDVITLSPQAQCLLAYYPKPNVFGNPQFNYEAPIVTSNHTQAFQLRMNRSAGPRDNFYGTIGVQSVRTSTPNYFGFVDKGDTLGIGGGGDGLVAWSHRFGQTFPIRNLFMTLGYNFSRQRTQITPFFANRTDVSTAAGINGNNKDPMNWGPPTLNFSASNLMGLTDQVARDNRNETNVGFVRLSVNHGRHYFEFGGDLRRQQNNYLQQLNPRGTFGFSSVKSATSLPGPNNTSTGGSDFADFIAGVPDTSALATGNADKYLRQTVYDGYVKDDWRMRPELTLNLGLRWEYGAPITELKQRLVNLDVAQGFTAVSPVLASSPTGSLTGQVFPQSLLRPDRSRTNFAPIVGLSWRPIPGSSLVVRAGAQIAHDTSVYQSMALSMAQQAPLSKSISQSFDPIACQMTLANAFNSCQGVPQNFAVDPNFHVGYAEIWQVSVQRDLPFALQMLAQYMGTKGTHGVQRFLPNTNPAGVTTPVCTGCPPVGFEYRTSGGNLSRQEGMFQLRRRLRSGFMASAIYKYSKSIDDDSVVGGAGPVSSSSSSGASTLAQDWRNLRAERGLSSFDQRHSLTLVGQYTTGMGIHGTGALLNGWRGAIYREWTFQTTITLGSGLPETPIYPATVSGTAQNSPYRPNITGVDLYSGLTPGFHVNMAAFSAPANGTYGNARRNSVTGPSQFKMDGSMARTFRLKDHYSMDARIDASNVLNHVTYTSWNVVYGNPQTFGEPVTANTMRSVTGTVRLRF